MTNYETSAPGKAVLAGEYAVLHGAPAISMAVDCRAIVNVQPAGRDWYSVRLPGENPVRFRLAADGAVEWEGGEDHADYALLEQVALHVDSALPGPSALRLDTRAFRDAETGLKLGFGSSSALAVALAAAWRGGDDDAARVESLAAAAHREFQQGRGSGVDVATAVRGGIIAFTRDRPAEKLAWPEGLRYAFFWCGKAASTADKLALEEEARNRGGRQAAGQLAEEAEKVCDTWRQGNDAAILSAFASYVEALRRFSADSNLGIFDAGHEDLARIAEQYGMVYKPSGAGGGDIGILLASKLADLGDFTARAEGLDFIRLAAALEQKGLVVDRREQE